MKKATTKLIDILTQLSCWDHHKTRDLLWSINVRYDYNKEVRYVLEHEGYIYDIDDVLKPSEREFYSYEDAENKLREILSKWIKEEINHHRLLHEEFKDDLKVGVMAEPSPFREEELKYYEKELEKYGA